MNVPFDDTSLILQVPSTVQGRFGKHGAFTKERLSKTSSVTKSQKSEWVKLPVLQISQKSGWVKLQKRGHLPSTIVRENHKVGFIFVFSMDVKAKLLSFEYYMWWTHTSMATKVQSSIVNKMWKYMLSILNMTCESNTCGMVFKANNLRL